MHRASWWTTVLLLDSCSTCEHIALANFWYALSRTTTRHAKYIQENCRTHNLWTQSNSAGAHPSSQASRHPESLMKNTKTKQNPKTNPKRPAQNRSHWNAQFGYNIIGQRASVIYGWRSLCRELVEVEIQAPFAAENSLRTRVQSGFSSCWPNPARLSMQSASRHEVMS